MSADPEVLRGLLKRADIYQHVLKTLQVGAPRLDPKTTETVARTIALKVRLAILKQQGAAQ